MHRNVTAWMMSGALVLAALGCGGSGSGPTETDVRAETPAAKTAQVTLSVRFPGQDQAAKSMLDPRTNRVVVGYESWSGEYLSETVTLTPENPTTTVNLVPGEYFFWAEARQVDDPQNEEDSGRLLAEATSYGTLVEGPNTVLLTFLGGSWSFVDGQGAASPIELSSAAGSLLLDGFELRYAGSYRETYREAGAQKSAYMGEGGMVFYWASRASETPNTPFSDLSRISDAYHMATFSGTTNQSSFNAGWYNLSRGCGEYDPFFSTYMEEGSICPEQAGDRLIVILGTDDMEDEYDYDPLLPDDSMTLDGEPADLTEIENTTVAGASRIAGNMAEVQIVSSEVEIVRPAAQAAKASSVSLTDRISVLRNALGGASKASQSANTELQGLTETWTEYAISCEDLNADGTVDQGDWEFYDPVDIDGDGETDAWEDGYLNWPYNAAECSAGLTLAEGGDPGEWIDYNGNGLIETYELDDRDGDGTVDSGDIQLGQYLLYTEVYNVWVYPFIATGTPGTQGVFSISNAFVQYRSFENSANNRYQAFVSVELSGAPIFESDIVDGSITGPGGELDILDDYVTYYRSRYLASTWQQAEGQFGDLFPNFESGFAINLSNYDTLPSGDYTVSLDTAFGTTVSTTVNLPATVELPVVASSSMSATWEEDGGLTFSWTEPEGSFDQYRLVLNSYDYTMGMNTAFFYGRIAPGISSITIPAAQIEEFDAALPAYIEAPTWVMQTRNYTGTHNYARGVSGSIPLPDPDEPL